MSCHVRRRIHIIGLCHVLSRSFHLGREMKYPNSRLSRPEPPSVNFLSMDSRLLYKSLVPLSGILEGDWVLEGGFLTRAQEGRGSWGKVLRLSLQKRPFEFESRFMVGCGESPKVGRECLVTGTLSLPSGTELNLFGRRGQMPGLLLINHIPWPRNLMLKEFPEEWRIIGGEDPKALAQLSLTGRTTWAETLRQIRMNLNKRRILRAKMVMGILFHFKLLQNFSPTPSF